MLKRLKNRFQLIGGDADAGVDDLEPHLFAMASDPKMHRSPVGKFHGVAEQIDQDLPEALLVAAHSDRQVRHGLVGKDDPLAGRPNLQGLHEKPQKFAELKIVGRRFQPLGFDFGQVQQIVDETQQMFPALLDHGEGVALGIGEIFRRFEQLRVAQNPVQGRAQFVAQIGEKVGLGAVGGFGELFGDQKLLLGVFLRGNIRAGTHIVQHVAPLVQLRFRLPGDPYHRTVGAEQTKLDV